MASDTLDTIEIEGSPPSQPRSPKTPLRLGDVVADLKDPVVEFTILNAETRVPMPEDSIRITNQADFYPKLRNPKDVKVVHFARIRGLETQNIDGIDKNELKTLETQVFNPPRGFVDCCMDLGPVKTWTENNEGCPLSLITGLKMVQEQLDSAPVTGSKLEDDQVGARDAGANQARATAGDQRDLATEPRSQFVGSSDYLLAYQVMEMSWRWKSRANAALGSSQSSKVDEDSNRPQRQAGPVEGQQTLGKEYGLTIASPPRWVIFRRD